MGKIIGMLRLALVPQAELARRSARQIRKSLVKLYHYRSGFLFWLVKAFTAKSKHTVGPRSVVLPGDGRSQFHQLWRGEALLQPLPQFGRYLGGRSGNGVRQLQHQLFIGRKEIAFRVPVEVAELIIAQACASAPGRVNVDSKR